MCACLRMYEFVSSIFIRHCELLIAQFLCECVSSAAGRFVFVSTLKNFVYFYIFAV